MGWEVKGYGQMLVLLDGGTEPLLAVFGKVVVRQERHRQRDVGFWWCKIAIKEGFVDDVESSAAAWFFEIGGHTPDGIDFELSVATAPQLFGCFKGGCCVFSEVAEKCESVMFGGSVKVWFSEGVLAFP